ncbi:hypothetical protein HW423_00175 [Aerococcaceae bacterium INB8]|uniref:PepSY domain-containing protein n=1 Tax=Ruoffia halotolerans TaxID=2748684 RepID=A0A839A2G8_9LACT|nr:hypothetical protein [Ruoffia halotolerans]MBA5728207.1 hypothetical protein [Ruoffia halotolerans]
MSHRNKGFLVAMLFVMLISPIRIAASESSSSTSDEELEQVELTEEDKVNYIRWFRAYDDLSQTPLDELKSTFETLISEGSTGMTKKEVIELAGEPAETFDAGASEFLLYYSINDEESAILYAQIFSEEKAAEASNAQAASTEAVESTEPEEGFAAPYLTEVNLLLVNETAFEPLNITLEEIETWQDAESDNREFTTFEELQELIGEPSEITYRFEDESWLYAWIRNSNETDSIDYVMAEVDADGNIVELNTIEDSEESSESVENSSLEASNNTDETAE